jgi:DNA-binding IclR family transcriptional regulator
MSTPQLDERYLVPALQRGLQLLAQFTREERELTGAELSRRLDLPRASVFRLLHTLEHMGFVERAPDGVSYKLGLAVLRIGFEYLAAMELTEHGRPILDALRDATGLSSHLVVRDAREVVFVAKSAGRSALFNSVQVGARLPAHATVLGRVLMGGLDLRALGELFAGVELTAFTPRTPTTLTELKTLIDDAAAKGYGVSQGGFETGISTIAAPVFNDRNEVVAAVSVTVPAQRVADNEVDGLVVAVRDAARQLTQRISHLPEHQSGSRKLNNNYSQKLAA